MPDGAEALLESAPLDPYGGSRKFKEDKVFEKELKEIRAAGKQVPTDDPGNVPDTRHELVGLALSGGGIRSASFALGVVQALNEREIFDEVDYMSTVSGGGYIGSCISALLQQHEAETEALKKKGLLPEGERPRLPFRHETGAVENAAFRHLRNYSNYLAPGKTGRFLRIPTLVFQGMLRNALVLLPIVLVASAALIFFAGIDIRNALLWPEGASQQWTYWLSGGAALFFLAWAAVAAPLASRLLIQSVQERHRTQSFAGARYAVVSRLTAMFGAILDIPDPLSKTPRDIRDTILAWTTGLFGVFLAAVFINLQPFATFSITHARYGLPIATAASGAGLAAIAATLARRAASAAIDRFGDRLLVAGLALLGPLTLWLIFLLLSSWALSPPGPLFGLFRTGFEGLASFLDEVGIGALAPDPTILDQCVMLHSLWPPVACGAFAGAATVVYILLAAGLFALFVALYDVNTASLHGFYRDRLSAAFLFEYGREEDRQSAYGLRTYDQLKLSQLSAGRPVHLINVAINVQDSQTRNMRGRNADFFLFSKLVTGGEYTGYAKTSEIEKYDLHLDLGAAMAISGAAIAPNSGIHTNRALRFLMMLANARLGYWMLNPLRISSPAPPRRWRERVQAFYFFDELFGWLSEERDYVYLTDGADIENLGAFELLRRRCKYIIISDASADPEMNFGALAQLIRLARIDLGVNIDIDVTDLRKSQPGLVRAHCALGTIRYGNGQVGQLLFIKSSVSGDENAYISEYRARHPEFPHENTTDQFFDEAQFEAYRALGHHIASGLFESHNAEVRTESGVSRRADEDEVDSKVGSWFRGLSRWLRPRPADLDEFLEVQQAAAALERRFADARLAPYFVQIHSEYANLGSSHAATEEMRRQALNLVRDQLFLIEKAVLKLQLGDPDNWDRPANRGLMNMFRRWSQTDLFRYGWAVCIADFTPDLRRFCREALDLRCDTSWRRVDRQVRADGLNAYEVEHYAERYPRAEIYMARLFVGTALPPVPGAAAPPLVEFDVASAYVERRGECDVLVCLRIRDTYRGQNLTLPLAGELRAALGAISGPLYYELDIQDADLAAAMHLTLRKAGFVPYPSQGAAVASALPGAA